MTEAIDLIKDIAYCYTVNHTNQALTVLLWGFALFAFAYNIVSIGIMTQKQYQDTFGPNDTLELSEGKYKYVKFLAIKIKRILKEHFHFHNEKEQKDDKCSKRIKYSLFFIAVFENLPQMVLQLFESF